MSEFANNRRQWVREICEIVRGLLPGTAKGEHAWTDAEWLAFGSDIEALHGRLDQEQAVAKIRAELRAKPVRSVAWGRVAGWLREVPRAAESPGDGPDTLLNRWLALSPEHRARLHHWLLGAVSLDDSGRFWAISATIDMVMRGERWGAAERAQVRKLVGRAMDAHSWLVSVWERGRTSKQEQEAERRGYYRWTEPYHGVHDTPNQWTEAERVAAMKEPWRSLSIRNMERAGSDADALAIARGGKAVEA